jgi:hypothetical protein
MADTATPSPGLDSPSHVTTMPPELLAQLVDLAGDAERIAAAMAATVDLLSCAPVGRPVAAADLGTLLAPWSAASETLARDLVAVLPRRPAPL